MTEDLLPWPRLARLLQRDGFDAVVVSSPENVTYMSEYWGLSHWARRGTQVYAIAWNAPVRSVDVILPATTADLVTDEISGRSRPHVYGTFPLREGSGPLTAEEWRLLSAANAPDGRGARAGEASGPLDALASALAATADGTRIAVERGGMDPAVLTGLEKLSGLSLAPAEPILAELRSVKSDREVAALRQAARITELAIDEALATARPGKAEQDVATAFLHSLVAQDALPQTTVIGTGRRSALPHGQPTSRPITVGDILRFDVGCRYRHYVSDIARTAAIGSPTRRQRAVYAALSEGLEAAAAALRPGATGADVFHAAMSAVRAAGVPDYQRGHCGHGIGIANYDLPRITPDGTDVIEPGMVVCLETPFYQIGDFGLQVEDTFVVTPSGADRVTSAPRELRALGT